MDRSHMDHSTYKGQCQTHKTLFQSGQEKEGTVQERKNNGVEEDTDLEPHILLLHKYLGQQLANHFLDPSYQFPLSPVQPLLPEIVGQSAKDYWRLLRERSESRLMKDITNVPGTLMRSTFTQLPSSKVLNHIQHFRKTMKLMYRTSEMNQDKAILMMANNPLLNLREEQMKGSPVQYLSKEDDLLTKIIYKTDCPKSTDNLFKGDIGLCRLSGWKEREFYERYIEKFSKINDHFSPSKPRNLGKPLQLPPLKATNRFTENESIGNLRTMAAGQKRFRFLTEDTSNNSESEFSKCFNEKREKKKTLDMKHICNQTTFIHSPTINAGRNESICSGSMPECTGRSFESVTYKALMNYRPSRIQSRKRDIRQHT